jgi:flagellar biosynthesis/type III secretory pathway protein FliH
MGRLVRGHGRVVPAVVVSAGEEAARLRAEAEATLTQARAEAEALRSEAQRQGRDEGLEAARAEATTVLLTARAEAESVRAAASGAALTLARRMAEKIVGRAVELDPAVLADIVARALAEARATSGAVVLRVHPDDLATVEATRARWAEGLDRRAQLRVVADERVGRHGCIVETTTVRLDARLETQLAALERALSAFLPPERER